MVPWKGRIMISREFLARLCCPATRAGLTLADEWLLARINREIREILRSQG